MKVLILVRKLDTGGAERQTAQLARALAAKGVTVTVVTFYPEGPFYRDLIALGIRLVSLDKRGRWEAVRFLWRLHRTIARENPDLMYSILDVPNVLSALLRILRPRTVLVWSLLISEMPARSLGRLAILFRLMELWLSRVPDVIISNSFSGRADAIRRGFPPARTIVLQNGIDTDLFHIDRAAGVAQRAAWGLAEDERLIGVVARVDPMKGHDVFLEAASRVLRTDPAVRFVVVGEGDPEYLQVLKRLADRLGLANMITWAGAHEDMRPVYNALDMLCMPSIYGEGMPNSVGEGMACGVPCVVTDVGDAASMVGELGTVVPGGDAEALAGACRAVLALSDGERAALGVALRERVIEDMGIERVDRRAQEVIELCRNKGNGTVRGTGDA
jgi:glycosyltransferase involved in cell wall biosynthesis